MTLLKNIDFLKCPITKQNLSMISDQSLEDLNNSIRNKSIFYYDGRVVEDLLKSAFINEDQSVVYMVKSGIIWMLNNFAIIVDIEKINVDTGKNFYKDAVKDFYDDIGWQQESDKHFKDARLFEDLRDVSRTYIKNCRLRTNKYISNSGKYLLDVASGPIQYEEYLTYSENYDYRVCVDISFRALLQAKDKLGEKGIYILGDVTNLPIRDNLIDTVISLHTIYHVPKDLQAAAIKEIYRVQKPGSNAVIIYSWGWNSILMNILIFPVQVFRALKRIFRIIKRQLIKSKIIDTAPGLYFYSHNYKWFKQQNFPFAIELKVWRSLHTHFLKFWIHKFLFGRIILNLIWNLEEKYPWFFGRTGSFPMFIIKKGMPGNFTQLER